jgi:hypothetical protein
MGSRRLLTGDESPATLSSKRNLGSFYVETRVLTTNHLHHEQVTSGPFHDS